MLFSAVATVLAAGSVWAQNTTSSSASSAASMASASSTSTPGNEGSTSSSSAVSTTSSGAAQSAAPSSSGSGYQLKQPPLDTEWTDKVGTNPWPEYPRPQQRRDQWQNLNGVWSYRNASSYDEVNSPPTGDLGTAVLVPSCLESGISGIMGFTAGTNNLYYSWYQTTFDVPSDWTENVLLNFGAVDYEATVFVNGQNVTTHAGGYNRFWVDITSALNQNGTNELVVFVFDPTDDPDYFVAVGKQTRNPSHIFYTPCSGIWQSVFIEPVPSTHVDWLDLAGDMYGQVNITVHTNNQQGGNIEVKVFDQGQVVATGHGSADEPVTFNVSDPCLWSPDSPKLYNMTVQLGGDVVTTYTGFRSLSKGVVNNVTRPLLNGEFVFALGTLDQGFWPDGIYLPPTYDAMVYDLQVLKEVGFNMLRKHIKVENDLFYHACDTMGLLVIQDQPSMTAIDQKPNATQQAVWESQLYEMVEKHRSFPSIYTWVIYNEGWAQLPSAPELYIEPIVKSLDPTRLVDAVTGWNDHGAGDYLDNHHYSSPQCGTPFYSLASSQYYPTNTDRIGFQGEFGGVGLNTTSEHLWPVQEAVDTVNQTYELDYNEEVWNYRTVCLAR